MYPDELEEVFEQIMSDEFSTDLQDHSHKEVLEFYKCKRTIMINHYMCE